MESEREDRRPSAVETFKSFLKDLEDEQRQRQLCSIEPQRLPSVAARSLRRLYQHFLSAKDGDGRKRASKRRGPASDIDDNDADADAGDEVRPRKAHRSHPWKTFVDLDSLELGQAERDAIEDAAQIWRGSNRRPSGSASRERETASPSPAVGQEEDNEAVGSSIALLEHSFQLEHQIKTAASPGDAMMASYWFMLDLTQRSNLDAIRWCYQVLAFYDMVRYRYPAVSGARVGVRMLDKMADMFEKAFDGERAKIDEATAHVGRWARWGKHLDHFCTEFGVGSLFLLARYLSPNFLESRFTSKGRYHDEAFEHLRQLRLRELASEPLLERLGAQIREELVRPFHGHAGDQRSGHGVE